VWVRDQKSFIHKPELIPCRATPFSYSNSLILSQYVTQTTCILRPPTFRPEQKLVLTHARPILHGGPKICATLFCNYIEFLSRFFLNFVPLETRIITLQLHVIYLLNDAMTSYVTHPRHILKLNMLSLKIKFLLTISVGM